MNGPGGVGEYDVRYIRMIADVIGEEGKPLSLGPKASEGLGLEVTTRCYLPHQPKVHQLLSWEGP